MPSSLPSLEGVIYRNGDRVGLQQNLSSKERWTKRESQKDIGGHVKDACHESVEEMGGIPSIG